MIANWLRLASLVSVAVAAGAFVGCGAEDLVANDVARDVASGDTASDDVASDDNASLDESDYGTAEEALMSCTNPDGTNAVMAALAVAVAQDLGRWQTGKDFVQGYNAGEIVALGSGSDASGAIGKSRCADGKCARVQALLDLQLDAAQNVYVQGSGSTKVLVNPQALRTRMLGKWREQKTIDERAKDGVTDQAPKEEHKLSFASAAKGGCDTNFTFNTSKTTGAALQYPNQLKYKLAFADIYNPYINFANLGGGKVSIDPTYGLDEDPTAAAQACTAACTKISVNSVAGGCCSCGGVTKKFVKAAWNNTTFLCQ